MSSINPKRFSGSGLSPRRTTPRTQAGTSLPSGSARKVPDVTASASATTVSPANGRWPKSAS